MSYDESVRALYIQFSDAEVAETVELSKYVYLDVDVKAQPVGMEILHADTAFAESLSGTTDAVELIEVLRRSAG